MNINKDIEQMLRFINKYQAILLLFLGVYSIALVITMILKYHYRLHDSDILFEVSVKSPLIIIAMLYFITKRWVDYKVNFISRTYSGHLKFRLVILFFVFTLIVIGSDILENAIARIQWDHYLNRISNKYTLFLTNKKAEAPMLVKNKHSIYIYRDNKHRYWAYFKNFKTQVNTSWHIQALNKLDKDKFSNTVYTGSKATFWKEKTLFLYHMAMGGPNDTAGKITTLLAPFSEEILFRGILYCLGLSYLVFFVREISRKRHLTFAKRRKIISFTKHLGKLTVFLILSLLFVELHISGARMSANLWGIFVFSLLAYYLRDRSQGLLLPTLLHMVTDWSIVIPYTSKLFVMASSAVFLFLKIHFPNIYF